MTAGPDDSQTMFRVLNEIGIIAQLSGNAFEKVMPDGMTLSQFTVLNHLVRLGDGRTPMSIAQAMQVTRGAMTNTLGHLQGKGFVDIEPDAHDGRSKRVALTPAGRAARDASIASLGPELAALVAAVSAADVAAALPLLEALRKILDARRNPVP